MFTILRRDLLGENTFVWEVGAPDVAAAALPGQFVMVRLRDGGERVPLTIADFDADRGTVTLVVQAVGRTTRDMMEHYEQGDEFQDLVGPLGMASEIGAAGRVVLIGGGLGVAPVFPQLRDYARSGAHTTAIIGFRRADLVFWEDRFDQWADRLIVCTDDGSQGRPGFVTDALSALLESGAQVDEVVAIGPLAMMRAVAQVTRPFGVHTTVSINAIMIDGTGMCGSCRVTVGGQVRFACVDGPEFDAHQVDFAELMARQCRFEEDERVASEDYAHVCQVDQALNIEGRRNYKKFKEVNPIRVVMPERDPVERAANFKEVNLGYSVEDALAEAERCVQCKRPTCVDGCPVGVDIPSVIRRVLVRDFDGALAIIREDNAFPSICGRVCPQESQCEAHCILARKIEPVAIGRLERFLGDHACAPTPAPPADAGRLGKVAIVGSGPGGLACAADLAKAGAAVTIFEALHVAGGVLSYGIPSFRLPRSTIARELESLEALGVRVVLNTVIGKTFGVHQLMEEQGYDAVLIATGAGYPRFLGIPGENAGMVVSANEFLTRVNLMGGEHFPFEDTPVAMGQRVVVLGAGNTAMDSLRTARRLGASEVRCVYRRTRCQAPARAEELRHAQEEGIEFHWLRSPVEIVLDSRQCVVGLRTQVMKLGPTDASGRRRPVPVEGAFETFDTDMVIYALGTRANPIISRSTPDLHTRGGGYVLADSLTQATNIPGVFAGGDIVTGGATVILALGAGRRAAASIVSWLEERAWPPPRPVAAVG